MPKRLADSLESLVFWRIMQGAIGAPTVPLVQTFLLDNWPKNRHPMVMGINGMIMTRDLFNLFIFIEITSIATYALIGMERTGPVLAAGFKYIIATSVATTFLLLGTIFIYYQAGTLNIDDIIQHSHLVMGPIGLIATLFVMTALLIELKPYPANGNYMLIDGTMTGKTTEEIIAAALDDNIYLKKIGELHGKTGYFRVTPGTDEENERFLKFIREYFG